MLRCARMSAVSEQLRSPLSAEQAARLSGRARSTTDAGFFIPWLASLREAKYCFLHVVQFNEDIVVKVLFVCVCVFFVAACSTGVEITNPPVDVAFSSPSASRATIGIAQTPLRTFSKDRQEVTGVRCVFQGQGYRGEAISPALINLPHRADESAPVIVTCVSNGESASARTEAFNATRQAQATNATTVLGGGVLGYLVGEAIADGRANRRDPKDDEWGYRPINVRF